MRNGPFVAAVQATRVPMVVTDPQITGNPIIYAYDAFVEMCRYERDDVLGQDYFFLLGQHASPDVAERVKSAMGDRQFMTDTGDYATSPAREDGTDAPKARTDGEHWYKSGLVLIHRSPVLAEAERRAPRLYCRKCERANRNLGK
jgi:PAS domain-containing protein